jgi:hypothetical protein
VLLLLHCLDEQPEHPVGHVLLPRLPEQVQVRGGEDGALEDGLAGLVVVRGRAARGEREVDAVEGLVAVHVHHVLRERVGLTLGTLNILF